MRRSDPDWGISVSTTGEFQRASSRLRWQRDGFSLTVPVARLRARGQTTGRKALSRRINSSARSSVEVARDALPSAPRIRAPAGA